MPKKVPLRQCLGCREMKPKRELIRVVRSPEGEVSLDFKGKKPGRGAYLCPDMACLKRARRAKALERAFSAVMPEAVYEGLLAQMEQKEAQGDA
ncbi:MAG: YlxR family protein [Oscillospiraceae bacterium]|nr:YlxR family protein [Oscillospiraceae bacterium]